MDEEDEDNEEEEVAEVAVAAVVAEMAAEVVVGTEDVEKWRREKESW